MHLLAVFSATIRWTGTKEIGMDEDDGENVNGVLQDDSAGNGWLMSSSLGKQLEILEW